MSRGVQPTGGISNAARLMRLLAVLLWIAGGCSDPAGPGDPALTVRLHASETQGLQLRVFVGNLSVLLSEPGEQRIEFSEGTYPVVTVLRDPSGSLRLEGGYAAWFAVGTDYWIDVLVGGQRPDGICVGEVTVLGLVAADSVFVVRNDLPRGAIC